ncbi:hypothetical protein [Mycobacterium sp.]
MAWRTPFLSNEHAPSAPAGRSPVAPGVTISDGAYVTGQNIPVDGGANFT